MTKYIKTGTTEFEQFNETSEQCFKFGIIDKANLTSVESVAYGADRYTIPTLEGDMIIHPTDWIVTGVNGEHWAVKDEIFQKTYKKLPVIPEYAADYIVYWKEQNNSLIDIALESAHTRMDSDDSSEAFDWVHNHFEKFSRAWLDGYEVAEVEE